MAVVFLASTQGQTLEPTDYVIICLLATLASIGTTPIPSASLVLIAVAVGTRRGPCRETHSRPGHRVGGG